MSRSIYIKKKIIVSLFFVIMGGIIFNSTFFLHSHRTACGKVIVHAHPFNKGAEKEDPLDQHQHSKFDLLFISSLDNFSNIRAYLRL
jgi:choline kinase